MIARAPQRNTRRRRAAAAAICATVLVPAATGRAAVPVVVPDPDDVPRLWDPRTRAPAPRFFDANGSAPSAEVPRFFHQRGAAPRREVRTASDAVHVHPWGKRMTSAISYAQARRGRIAFAVVDEAGRLHAHHGDETHRSASVIKAMFMVAYLNRAAVRGRDLTRADRKLLRPMITRSDNDAASRTRDILGPGPVYAVARSAGMKRFTLKGNWGDSLITAADQALFFSRIDLLVVPRHRVYARKLLGRIVPEQRWGIPPAVPRGWSIRFKGGWLRGLVSQAALVEQGERRIGLAVLTDGDPSHGYGAATLRGVARRLLRGLR